VPIHYTLQLTPMLITTAASTRPQASPKGSTVLIPRGAPEVALRIELGVE